MLDNFVCVGFFFVCLFASCYFILEGGKKSLMRGAKFSFTSLSLAFDGDE